jgi:DNA-directed RNA polymerase specialized sigma24 family protein
VAYVLKEVEGYSHDEIADLLGITANLSSVRLYRARRWLKKRLGGKI